MSLPILLAVYCACIVFASLLGGWLPSLVKLSHLRLQLTMSFVSGLMLGIAMLHLLPHAAEHLGSMPEVAGAMLGGLLVMFFLLRVFHVHGHGDSDHHDCGHDHAHHGEEGRRLHWVGLYFGLSVHTLLDGVALAASVVAEAHGETTLALLGFGTFLAVALHKPLDALAITSLMKAGGWSNRSQTAANFGYALMCPLGALLFWLGAEAVGQSSEFIGYALAFSAGFFLCIALGDLLPEVQFHTHDRWKLSAALLGGVALAYGIELTHSHDSHDSHDGHAHSERDHQPQALTDAVEKIQHLGEDVADSFEANAPEDAHSALHELGSLLAGLPKLVDDSDLAADDRAAAKQAGQTLFDDYDRLDQLMHGKGDDVQPSTAYSEVKESIAEAMNSLMRSAQSTSR